MSRISGRFMAACARRPLHGRSVIAVAIQLIDMQSALICRNSCASIRTDAVCPHQCRWMSAATGKRLIAHAPGLATGHAGFTLRPRRGPAWARSPSPLRPFRRPQWQPVLGRAGVTAAACDILPVAGCTITRFTVRISRRYLKLSTKCRLHEQSQTFLLHGSVRLELSKHVWQAHCEARWNLSACIGATCYHARMKCIIKETRDHDPGNVKCKNSSACVCMSAQCTQQHQAPAGMHIGYACYMAVFEKEISRLVI